MPTIAFISPKGGVGKITAALLLASQLARGAKVSVINADPNHPITAWGKDAELPEKLSIIANVDEDNILDRIEEAAAQTPFVIVDLEGTAAKIVLLAVSQADLVVIPMQGSQLDAEQASRAIRVLKQHEKMTSRAVPYGVLLSRTSPIIRTRTMGISRMVWKKLASRCLRRSSMSGRRFARSSPSDRRSICWTRRMCPISTRRSLMPSNLRLR